MVRTITSGSNCSSNGTVNGTVDDNGDVSGTSHGNATCSDTTVRLYTIKVGDNTFLVKPVPTVKQKAAAMATLGWSAVFAKTKRPIQRTSRR